MRYTIWLTLALATTAYWAVPVAVARGASADDQYAVAAEHYARGRWQLAVDEFSDYLAKHGGEDRADAVRFFLGEALVQLGRYDAAQTAFAEFLQGAPRHLFARQAEFRVGETLFLLGEREAAQPWLNQFRTRYPRDPLNAYVLPYLGETALAAENGVVAVQTYREALRRYPQGPLVDETRFGLAKALALEDQLDEAIANYRVLAGKPDSPLAAAAQLNMGMLYYRRADYASVGRELARLESTFPDSSLLPECRYWQAAALTATDKWEEAAAILEPLVRDSPDHAFSAATHFLLAESFRRTGKPDDARHYYETTQQRWPASSWGDDALQILVQLHFQRKAFDAAEREAERFLAQYPESPLRTRVEQTRARCFMQRHEFAAAVTVLREVADQLSEEVGRDEEDSDLQSLLATTRYYLSMAQLGEGDELGALESLTAITEPQDEAFATRVRLARASILVARRRYQDAIGPLRECLRAAPGTADHADILAKLVVCFTETGDVEQAAEHHRQYAERFAEHELFLPTTQFLAGAAHGEQHWQLAESLYWRLAETTGDAAQPFRMAGLTGLGRLYAETARSADAAAVLAKLVDLAPESAAAPVAALSRAKVLGGEAAVAAYRELADRFPQTEQAPVGLFEAARRLHEEGRDAEALPLLKRLADEYDSFAEMDAALYLTAWVSFDLGRSGDAYAAFERLVREHKDSDYWGDSVYRLAERARSAGNWSRVAELLAELLEHGCGDEIRGHVLYLATQAAVHRKRWPEILPLSRRLLAEFPESPLVPAATYWMAESHFRQQQFNEAEPLLNDLAAETAGQQADWVAMIPLRLAQIDVQRKDWSAALERAERIEASFPDFQQQYEADYVIGRCLAAKAKFSAARQAYQRVVDSPAGGHSETAAKAQWMIGESYFHQQAYRDAIRAYFRVVSLFAYPRWQAAALLQAAKCYTLQGDRKEALRLYEQVVKEYPETPFAKEARERLSTARRLDNGVLLR